MGDIVRVSKKSEHYDSYGNPKDTNGKIIKIDHDEMHHGGYGLTVRWDSGGTNQYRMGDLKMRRNGGNHGRGDES